MTRTTDTRNVVLFHPQKRLPTSKQFMIMSHSKTIQPNYNAAVRLVVFPFCQVPDTPETDPAEWKTAIAQYESAAPNTIVDFVLVNKRASTVFFSTLSTTDSLSWRIPNSCAYLSTFLRFNWLLPCRMPLFLTREDSDFFCIFFCGLLCLFLIPILHAPFATLPSALQVNVISIDNILRRHLNSVTRIDISYNYLRNSGVISLAYVFKSLGIQFVLTCILSCVYVHRYACMRIPHFFMLSKLCWCV